jgi:hypothetical protein
VAWRSEFRFCLTWTGRVRRHVPEPVTRRRDRDGRASAAPLLISEEEVWIALQGPTDSFRSGLRAGSALVRRQFAESPGLISFDIKYLLRSEFGTIIQRRKIQAGFAALVSGAQS